MIILPIALIGILFLIRNHRVYKERMRVIDIVYSGDDWVEKRSLFERYSYDEMFYKFWIPVKWFYKDII